MTTKQKAREWKAIVFQPEDMDDVIAGELHHVELHGVEYITVKEVIPNDISDTEMLEHLIENEDRLIRSIHTGMWTTTMAKRYFNSPREAIRAAMAGEKK